ncbi:unnamed protein product, partial [Adineta steineri]
DEAIELADRALTMTKDERIEDFSDLLKDALNQTKNSVRRRKTSVEKNEEEGEGGEENGENKQHARDSSLSSNSSLIAEVKTEETNTTEKPSVSHRKPAAFNQNGSTTLEEDDQTVKKKRGRKPKSETNTLSNSTVRF